MREPQAAGSAALRDRRPARYAALDETVLRMLAAGDGVVSYHALRGLGYSLNDVSSLVRQGLLVRLWHGRYGDGATSKTLDAGPRHLLTARAVLAGMPRHALSHQTALLAWSLPVLRRDLDIVHVSGIDFDRSRRATGMGATGSPCSG